MDKIKGKSLSKTPEIIKKDGEWNLGQTLKKNATASPSLINFSVDLIFWHLLLDI